MKQPRQDRSQQTLNRLLDAAEVLLNQKPWAEITIQEIIREAGSSVGSFYARFEDKQALLTALSDRLSQHVAAEADNNQTGIGDDQRAYIRATLGRLVRFYRKRHGLIRALTLVPRVNNETSLRAGGLRNAGVFEALVASLGQLTDDPVRARMGLFVVVTAVREKVSFSESAEVLIKISDKRLVEELTDLLIAYLGENP